MNTNLRHKLLLGMAILLPVAPVALGSDWPNFRGPRHDGISDAAGFKTAFSSAPPVIWEKSLGSGFSSFAVSGNRLYTAGTADKRQVVYCLNADTGDEMWRYDLESQYPERAGGDGPRATPTINDGRLYILGAKGTLACLDAESGRKIWDKKFSNEPQWGYSGSVLIEGDLAVVSAGKGDGALVAFNKKNGETVWKTGDDIVGYATPYPFTFDGTRYIAGFTGSEAMIVEADTGTLAWSMPWITDWKVNSAAPIFHDGSLFLSSGYKTGCGLYKLAKTGKKITAKETWRSKVLMNKFQSCILLDGHLYSSDQNALVCVEFATGKEKWRQRRIKHGTIVVADGQLILLTQDGRLRIGKASPDGFEPTTDLQVLSDRCWTVPVIHDGRLFVRDLNRMIAFNLAG